MRPDIAQATLKFLERITLSPAEIPAFRTVIEALQEAAGASPIAPQGETDGDPILHDAPAEL